MTLYLDPAIFRPWLGNATTEDQLIRSLLRHQCTDTGADLFTASVSRQVAEMLAAKRPTRAIIEVATAHVFTLVNPRNGEVVAALDPGAKREPFHQHHWQKQGHAAAAAIILHLGGRPAYAGAIIDRLMREQEREDPLAIHGLWHAGTHIINWPGWWSWVNRVYPFEDCTQVANACALYAFDRLQHFRFAVDGMREVIRRSGVSLVPYCASVRSGLPEWGRAVAPAAWSIEESANVAMLLAAAGHTDEASRIRDSILMAAANADGSWARFLDPHSMLTAYVRRDPANPSKPCGIGELTRDRAEAYELGGFSTPTVRPAMLDAVLPPSKYQEVTP